MIKFAPGEPVFHQGQVRQEFFGLIEGRFAKVRFNSAPTSRDLDSLFANAELLEIFEHPDQVFGEIDVLLQQPHNFSVFALDPAEAVTIPVNADTMRQSIKRFPGCGLATCISLAAKLRDALGDYARLLREEDAVDGVVAGAAADYIEAIRAIAEYSEGIPLDELIDKAMSHPSCTLSERVINSAPVSMVTQEKFGGGRIRTNSRASIGSAVMPSSAIRDGVRVYNAGTSLCLAGGYGDRLYILREGIVEVRLDGGARIQISRPGSIIGEIAVLLNLAAERGVMPAPAVRTANVVCLTQVTALSIPLDQVEEFLAARPEVLTDLMLALTMRARETRKSCEDVRQRLSLKLNKLLKPFLEGHHALAWKLEAMHDDPGLDEVFRLTSKRSRNIYDRFAATLRVLDGTREGRLFKSAM
ncbi:MAG: cyclic nucleotide-binding domain-containing protein [Candidatus Riflebacteria bacterium]|nr:cyclic nucleotide-binding domain-containing protein [Candidatus Riflebacteria bacterium]